MITFTRFLKATLALVLSGLSVAPFAHAITPDQFYTLSKEKRIDYIVDTLNEMSRTLRSEIDNKGQRKPPELLAKQKDLADFMVNLFNETNSEGLPVHYAGVYNLIYYSSLRDKSTSVESLIISYVMKRYKEKLAVDATNVKSSQVAAEATAHPALE